MASSVSGTYSFSLDVDDIINDALDLIGGEHITGGEAKKARRVLNVILLRLRNKNIPLNAITTISIPLLANTTSYTVDSIYSSVLDVNYYNLQSKLTNSLEYYGIKEFNNIPTQSQTGNRPTVYSIDKGIDNEVIKIWPKPASTVGDSLQVLVATNVQDITASYQRVALNKRYLPLLIDWLAYEMSLRRTNVPQELRMELKSKLEETMSDAFEEDRERADFSVTIGGISGR